MSDDGLAKFKGGAPMGGVPKVDGNPIFPHGPESLMSREEYERSKALSEDLAKSFHRASICRSLECILVQNGSNAMIEGIREHSTNLERTLRASIEELVVKAHEMDIPEEQKEAISFHLFRKLDELSSAIDTVNEKTNAIRMVDLSAVIKRLCSEE